jgi:hypothetical protein
MTVRVHLPASSAVSSKRGLLVTHMIELSAVPRFYPDSTADKSIFPC